MSLFDPLEREPDRATAGDVWIWRRDDLASDYPPADFALAYVFTPETGGTPVQIAATSDATGYLVTVPSATTDDFAAGRLAWRATLTRSADSARMTLCEGVITVAPDPAAATAGDLRSTNRRILDALEARLQGRITADAESYTIEGRSLVRMPIEQVERLVEKYRAKVAVEEGRPLITRRRVAFR